MRFAAFALTVVAVAFLSSMPSAAADDPPTTDSTLEVTVPETTVPEPATTTEPVHLPPPAPVPRPVRKNAEAVRRMPGTTPAPARRLVPPSTVSASSSSTTSTTEFGVLVTPGPWTPSGSTTTTTTRAGEQDVAAVGTIRPPRVRFNGWDYLKFGGLSLVAVGSFVLAAMRPRRQT